MPNAGNASLAVKAEADLLRTRVLSPEEHDHEKCCAYLRCAHPACCGYYGQPRILPPGEGNQ